MYLHYGYWCKNVGLKILMLIDMTTKQCGGPVEGSILGHRLQNLLHCIQRIVLIDVTDWPPTNHCNSGYYWMAGYLPYRQRPYWNLTDGVLALTYRNYQRDAYLAVIALTYKMVPGALEFNVYSNGQWMWEEATFTHQHCFVCKLPEAIY